MPLAGGLAAALEIGEQALLEDFSHPLHGLLRTAPSEITAAGNFGMALLDFVPKFVEPGILLRRHGEHRRRPARIAGSENVQSGLVFDGGAKRALDIVAVGLVHGDD